MKLKALGVYGSSLPGFRLTSFLIDNKILIDSGSVTSSLSLKEQAKIETILLSHTHIDHSLGILLLADNLVGTRKESIKILSTKKVLDSLMIDLLNNRIWPDFTRISNPGGEPLLRLQAVKEGKKVKIGGYSFSVISVTHSVPTVGFFIGDGKSTLVYTADTKHTSKIWQRAKKIKNVKAVIIETSFPNALQRLADISGHLTPQSLAREIEYSGLQVPFYVYHIKPKFLNQVKKEIAGLKHPLIKFLKDGGSYRL
ncbi:MAG: 3',5'-cyclic-nucleotide phosphodiesterase [Candidatus Edwardsbacteria bacterium]